MPKHTFDLVKFDPPTPSLTDQYHQVQLAICLLGQGYVRVQELNVIQLPVLMKQK